MVEGCCQGDVVSLIASGLLDDPEQFVGAADVHRRVPDDLVSGWSLQGVDDPGGSLGLSLRLECQEETCFLYEVEFVEF